MSRIGKKPIPIPTGVDVKIENRRVAVSCKNHRLEWALPGPLQVTLDAGTLRVDNPSPSKLSNGMWGSTRTVLNNMMIGVQSGFTKTLEIVGTGYRVTLKGRTLALEIGFDHPVEYTVEEGVEVSVKDRPMRIILQGCDIQRVGQVAAEIRALKKPEPYHGKGIRYENEQIRKKAGKAGA
ncbi:MAG: 50S ribosomal protein L6 [Candidatus Eisenbacteria bacterium]